MWPRAEGCETGLGWITGDPRVPGSELVCIQMQGDRKVSGEKSHAPGTLPQ